MTIVNRPVIHTEHGELLAKGEKKKKKFYFNQKKKF